MDLYQLMTQKLTNIFMYGQKINLYISVILVILLTYPIFCNSDQANKTINEKSNWMSGNWGLRVLLPAGNIKEVKKYDPVKLVNQIKQLKSMKWVMLNLTSGGYGGRFTAPNSILKGKVIDDYFPERDLLLETINLLKKNNYKVIVYFAADGPLANTLYNRSVNEDRETKRIANKYLKNKKSWENYLVDTKKTNDQLLSEIIEYYSEKYGKKIDGWWFDHGKWGDPEKYIKAAKTGNPDAKVAWNDKKKNIQISILPSKIINLWCMERSHINEDFTAGHITPIRTIEPWSHFNDLVIQDVENTKHKGDTKSGIQSHIFIPLQRTWRGGETRFTSEQIKNWTRRVISSDGAITWAIAMRSPEHQYPGVSLEQFKLLKALDQSILNNEN
ncbi:MAG: hypothetical protein JAY85_13965 [Candidatus Thiodiazotropha weberae]|nr:hypothetical protein [Candidatus Thiodiazotropha weberae]